MLIACLEWEGFFMKCLASNLKTRKMNKLVGCLNFYVNDQ